MRKIIILYHILVFVVAVSTSAATRLVPSQYPTIQAAVDDCNDGDVVIIAPGRYTGTGNRDIDFKGKAITVRSTDPNDTNVVAATIIDCNGTVEKPHRGFRFNKSEEPDSILDGFTIIRGYAPVEIIEIVGPRGPTSIKFESGGAILIYRSNPTVKNCILSRNKANGTGGGIQCIQSSPLVINTTLRDNVANGGGGGIACIESSPLVINTTLRGNIANGGGGGVYCNGNSDPTIINCNFSNNLSYYQGGGIFVDHSSPNIFTCSFIKNVAKDHPNCAGGAIMNNGGRATIRNCLFIGNTAGGGGGIHNYGSQPEITNCTFCENSALLAGGILNYGSSHPTLTNCILWANRDSGPIDESAQIYGGSSNLPIINYCCIQSWTGNLGGIGNIGADPCFAQPGYWDPNGTPADINDDFWVDGDYHLKSQAGRWDPLIAGWIKDDVTSPCIDAGDPASPIGYEPFPNGGIINMGTYGGIAEASKSYFGEPVCETIVAGDINGDCIVNFKDFAIFAKNWLNFTGKSMNFRSYWPFTVGNRWDSEPIPDGGFTLKITDHFFINGFEIWEFTNVYGSIRGSVTKIFYYVYINEALYATEDRTDLDGLPEISGKLKPLFPEVIRLEIPIYVPNLGTVIALQGTLADVLKDTAYRVEDFPFGDQNNVLAFVKDGNVRAIFASGPGPILLYDLRILDATVIGSGLLRVNITTPPNGAMLYYLFPITIGTDVLDVDGPAAKVEFFANGTKIGEDNNGSDGWKINWDNHPEGVYTLAAKVVNDRGLAAFSPSIVIILTSTPPKGRTCFPSDTLVWIDGLLVEISKVTAGQTVGKFNCLAVTASLKQIETVQEHEGTFECLDITLENGNTISVVDSHCFLLDSGQWAPVQKLTTGSKLKSLEGLITVRSIVKREKPFVGKVYNLKIKDTDWYLVGRDGIVVRDY